MNGYTISQVAERTGFPPSTLRFYERSGLVRPERTPGGYRSYDDRHINRLQFIARAKGFGLTLDEITGLLPLLDEERCAPVQNRLRHLIAGKIRSIHRRVADSTTFVAELRRVAATLSAHTVQGPCDATCGCISDPTDAEPLTGNTGSPSNTKPCVAGWRTVVALAERHDDIPGGVRLQFARDVDVPTIAAVAAAQQDCCQFITFNLGIAPDAVTLDITGPDDARAVIDALVQTGTNDQRASMSGAFVVEPCEPAGCAPPSNGSVEVEHDPVAAGPTVSPEGQPREPDTNLNPSGDRRPARRRRRTVPDRDLDRSSGTRRAPRRAARRGHRRGNPQRRGSRRGGEQAHSDNAEGDDEAAHGEERVLGIDATSPAAIGAGIALSIAAAAAVLWRR